MGKRSNLIYLLVITLVAFALRMWKLDFQSPWLDELHTLILADYNNSWDYFFTYLKGYDVHPPFHYGAVRLFTGIFGLNIFNARLVSVIAAMISIPVMYKLGEELYSKKAGLIAALFTSVNYYHIYYSQEARDYMFLFLFASLSYLYFIRVVKSPTIKHALFYGVATTGLLYSHLYGMFSLASQGILACYLLATIPGNGRKKLALHLFLGVAVALLGFSFWIPVVLNLSGTSSFWVQPPASSFYIDFVLEYFGNADLLSPFLLLFALIFIIDVAAEKHTKNSNILNLPGSLSFVVIFSWLVVTLVLPYVKSLVDTPILFPRYTISVLPAVMLLLSLGASRIKSPHVQHVLVFAFLVFSILDIYWVRNYNGAKYKTQFREAMEFLAENNQGEYPVLNELTAWQTDYYFKKLKLSNDTLGGNKNRVVQEILDGRSEKYDLEGFWLIRFHGDADLESGIRGQLLSSHTLLHEAHLVDAHVELFIDNEAMKRGIHRYSYASFKGEGNVLHDQQLFGQWSGTAAVDSAHIAPGNYQLNLTMYGSSARDTFPLVEVMADGVVLDTVLLSGDLNTYTLPWLKSDEGLSAFQFNLLNDYSSLEEGDRNIYYKELFFTKQN